MDLVIVAKNKRKKEKERKERKQINRDKGAIPMLKTQIKKKKKSREPLAKVF